jgi:membrane-associated phospholipid phosphatase
MRMGKWPRSAAAVAVLLVLAVPRPAAAQAEAGEGPGARLTLAGAGRDFLRDEGRIWSSPARIRAKDIAPLLAVAATTTFLIAADERVRDSVQAYTEGHPWVGDVGPVITHMGAVGAWATAGAFFGLGLILEDERARDTGALAAFALAHSFIAANVLKGLSGRQRPSFADGADRWWGPVGVVNRHEEGQAGKYVSFPSGHTTNAFTLATVVALQYRHRAWVPVLAYAVASAVGLSRMTMDRHWASDVFCGALLGQAIARLVVHDQDRRRRIVPMVACSRRGVSLTLLLDLDPGGF